MAGEQATVMLDGIQLNGMCGNGATQSYSNTQNYEEIVIQNSGAGADVSAGGVRQYLIPRKGGNQFHGSGAALYAGGNWQADPLTDDLVKRGLTRGNAFDSIYDFEAGVGGKFVKDKLWWFGAARKQGNNVIVADTFYKDGTQGINEQYIKNVSARLTPDQPVAARSRLQPISSLSNQHLPARDCTALWHAGLVRGRDPARPLDGHGDGGVPDDVVDTGSDAALSRRIPLLRHGQP
jgi:hypothetical protein